MAPRTRKLAVKRRANKVVPDGDGIKEQGQQNEQELGDGIEERGQKQNDQEPDDGIHEHGQQQNEQEPETGVEEHGQQQNEQEPDVEVVSQQPVQSEGMAPSSRRATASRNANSAFQDKQKMVEIRQPQIFSKASREQAMGPRTRKVTESQSVSRRFEEMDQIGADEQHQNEEELEFHTSQQTNRRQVPRSQRSTVNRSLNHGFLDEDEMEEYGEQANQQHSNLVVAEALKNALQMLMAPDTRRATTNQNSHRGFQDKRQGAENGLWQNRRTTSQQVSMMVPTTRKATRNEEQLDYQMTQQVMAPITGRSTAKRKLNPVLLDEDEIEEQELQGNEQSNLKFTREIENALKILMDPSTRRTIANLNTNSGFRDKNQMKQPQNRKQLQPQISHQASMMASRTRKGTTVQSRYHRLQDEDQLERDGQYQNKEQPEFRTTRQTKDKQVMTRSTRRSTAQVNHGLLDEDEIEDHGQEENEQVSDMEVNQAIENALKILTTPSTEKATTSKISHRGFPDRHRIIETRQQQSRQQQQPQVSQQASISAAMPRRTQNASGNQSKYHRLQDEDQMEGDEQEQNEEPTEIEIALKTYNEKGTLKNPRGPTLLREIWGRYSDEERIKVDFNKRGQPVGTNKKKFTGFLGTLARNGKYSPLDIEDWRKVPKENKEEMIKLVKERFEVPVGVEHWVLLSIGKKRNSWRSRVKTQYFDPTLPIEDQMHKIPPRVDKEQWKNLCLYWANEDVMEECERNKANRQRSVLHQTTGKFSFAEVEEQLRERLGRSPTRVEMFAACFTRRDGNPSNREVGDALTRMRDQQSKLPQGSQDPVRPDDSFAKVIGNDPPGKIRMLGLGASQSDVWGVIPSRSACYQMVLENQAVISRMEEKIEQFTKLVGSLQEKVQPKQNPNNIHIPHTPASPGQSSNSNIVERKLQVGDSVLLKSLFDQKKIVAKGCLESLDPDQYVGGRRLGSNWYGVQISVPIEWDEDLIRPYSNFSTVGDAVGICIAWPHHLVTSEDNQE